MPTINFTVRDHKGRPVQNTAFKITTGVPDTGYVPGMILPAATLATTNSLGQFTVTLTATEAPYYVSKANNSSDEHVAYKLFVPDIDGTLAAEMLCVDVGLHQELLNDRSLAALIDAKVSTHNRTMLINDVMLANYQALVELQAENTTLESLNAHIAASNAHSQYQRNDGLANNSDGIWCGAAGGTANAITLSLPALPVTQIYLAYKAGTRFTFKASADNTSAVTVNIAGLGAKAITKDGAEPLVAADLKNGGIYEIVYDGTQFQVSGSVGNIPQVMDVHEFTGAGPYTLDYTVGRVSAYLNGLLLISSDFTATNGTSISVPSAGPGDKVVFICYSTFTVADTYTIAQTDDIVGHARNGILTYLSGTELKFDRANGNRQYINGKNELIPLGGVNLTLASPLSTNTLYYVYAYISSGSMLLEASVTGYATSTSTGEKIKSGDGTRALVGMVRTNGSGYFDNYNPALLRSWHNDPGFSAVMGLSANRSLSDSVTPGEWVEMSLTGERNYFLAWADESVLATVTGGALLDLGSGDDASGHLTVAFNGVSAEEGGSVIGGVTAGALSSADWSPISMHCQRSGLATGYHYATIIGLLDVISGTGISLVCQGSGYTGRRTCLRISTQPKYR